MATSPVETTAHRPLQPRAQDNPRDRDWILLPRTIDGKHNPYEKSIANIRKEAGTPPGAGYNAGMRPNAQRST